jgi:hypothetical protein
MKIRHLIPALLLFANIAAHSQDLLWKAGVHTFFDNAEFGGSTSLTPQTMAGVHVAPEIGLALDGRHSVHAGIDLLHEYGSDKAIDIYTPVAYYQYEGAPFRFYAGSIPRNMILEKYPRMFFTDSISNYRPTINGIFWEYGTSKKYANLWLDWTGRQSEARREAFFIGWSGRYYNKMFYAQHFGYMFHYAKTKNPVSDEFIHDNGLTLTSVGLDLSETFGLEKFETGIGYSLALDRDRGAGKWNAPQGMLWELKAEYKGLGLFNTYYKGEGQQIYRADHGSDLYWGDPAYGADEYERVDLYIRFMHTKAVKLKFTYSIHLRDKHIYHQQALYATFDLDNIKGKAEAKKYSYIWDDWF